MDESQNYYRLLVSELTRLRLRRKLFAFVSAKLVEAPNGQTQPVSATNNEAERTLRFTTEARKTGRTGKTLPGARCRTVIVSVLDALRQHPEEWTFSSVIAEVRHWGQTSQS